MTVPRSNDMVVLECIKFIPSIIPDDYELPFVSETRRVGTDEPLKKKQRVKTATATITVEAAPALPLQAKGHHLTNLHPKDTYRPKPVPRSILEQPGQRVSPTQHPFAAPPPPLSRALPQSSWRPPTFTGPQNVFTPTVSVVNGNHNGHA